MAGSLIAHQWPSCYFSLLETLLGGYSGISVVGRPQKLLCYQPDWLSWAAETVQWGGYPAKHQEVVGDKAQDWALSCVLTTSPAANIDS